MAYHQARFGVCYVGAVLSGVSDRSITLSIGGTSRGANIVKGTGFTIEQRLDGAWSARFYVTGFTPALLSDVLITFRVPDQYVFSGLIMRVRVAAQRGQRAVWEIECQDYTWLMNRYAVVRASYRSQGIPTILRRIISSFTDPASNFRVGYAPSTLGNIDETGIQFDGDTVGAAIDKLADIAQAYWLIRRFGAYRVVDMFTTYWPNGNSVNLTQTSDFDSVSYGEDATQLRTKAEVIGKPTTAPIGSAKGATTVAVADPSNFSPTGGTAKVGTQVFTYTGYTTTTDPVTGDIIGQLEGVVGEVGGSGLDEDIAVGEYVKVVGTNEDATAQASIAALLGGGQSGVVISTSAQPDASQTAADDLAESDVDVFSGSSPLKSFEYRTRNPFVTPGKTLSVTLSDPITVTGSSYRIQSVTLESFRDSSGDHFHRRVSCAQTATNFADLVATALIRSGAV